MIRMEFGIIDELDPDRDYSRTYDPEKFGCMTLDDDLYMNDWYVAALDMPSYFSMIRKAMAESKYMIHFGV